jgi:hypothetical protein
LTVSRKLYYSAIIIGVLLLLLAGALALRIGSPASQSATPQRGDVVQAVNYLGEGCLRCHQSTQAYSSSLDRPITVLNLSHTHSTVLSASDTVSMQTEIDLQLAELGRRLLALPITHGPEQKRAFDTFLDTYHETRQINRATVSTSISLIERLTLMIHDLENQANPNQIRRAESLLSPPDVAALLVPPLSGTALIEVLPLQRIIPNRWTLLHESHEFVPSIDIAFAEHRRGPPADSACFASIVVGWETAVL